MRPRHMMQETDERRIILRRKRGEILGKIISEKEKRSRWLVQLMDIEDELEELSSSVRKKDLKLIYQE